VTRSVGVVGAGMVGLATAWFLQERGIEVTVLERRDVAAGASLGNAGWLSPAMTTPLPEPRVLAYGLNALLKRDAPFRVPPRSLTSSAPFLLRFAANCTGRRFAAGLAAFRGIAAAALPAYDALAAGGVEAATHESAVYAAFEDPRGVLELQHELELVARGGIDARTAVLGAGEIHAEVPVLSPLIRHGLRLEGQRFIDPGAFVASLAESVAGRGGKIEAGVSVREVVAGLSGVAVETSSGQRRFDDLVLASGAWLGALARRFGVRVPVAAGRGYSLHVGSRVPLASPLYLPAARVACTPLQGGIRLAGTMEITSPDAPLDKRRIDAIVSSAARLLSGDVLLATASSTWVGPRPITSDGLPLIGATAAPHVFVAGGHGMWGITLGPATGQLLCELVVTGAPPEALLPFDPLRSSPPLRRG